MLEFLSTTRAGTFWTSESKTTGITNIFLEILTIKRNKYKLSNFYKLL